MPLRLPPHALDVDDDRSLAAGLDRHAIFPPTPDADDEDADAAAAAAGCAGQGPADAARGRAGDEDDEGDAGAGELFVARGFSERVCIVLRESRSDLGVDVYALRLSDNGDAVHCARHAKILRAATLQELDDEVDALTPAQACRCLRIALSADMLAAPQVVEEGGPARRQLFYSAARLRRWLLADPPALFGDVVQKLVDEPGRSLDVPLPSEHPLASLMAVSVDGSVSSTNVFLALLTQPQLFDYH